jgi:hypothetical protein
MSLMLLATTALDRMRARMRLWLPDSRPSLPRTDWPGEQRKRLRQDVLARGGSPDEIERIGGNCPDQIKQQIGDLSRWLERHHGTANAR